MFNSLSLPSPGRIITVWPSDQYAPNSLEGEANPLGVCGDMYVLIPCSHDPDIALVLRKFPSTLISTCSRWYFRCFLSSDQERQTVGALLRSRVWRMPWQIFSPVEECRTTRVLAMKGVLRRIFGFGWNSPSAGLNLSMDYRPKH